MRSRHTEKDEASSAHAIESSKNGQKWSTFIETGHSWKPFKIYGPSFKRQWKHQLSAKTSWPISQTTSASSTHQATAWEEWSSANYQPYRRQFFAYNGHRRYQAILSHLTNHTENLPTLTLRWLASSSSGFASKPEEEEASHLKARVGKFPVWIVK